MLMVTKLQAFAACHRPEEAGLPADGLSRYAEEQAPSGVSAESGGLQLAIDAVGELVESLVDANLLRNHLLQRGRPFGGQIEEQGLRRKIDLRAGRRDVVLLEIAWIGLRDPVAELAVLPHRGTYGVDEVHFARAEQVVLGGRRPLHEQPGCILLLREARQRE